METGVLGPLLVIGPRGEIPLAGAKERTVLAHLVARIGQVVAAEEMVDALWPADPPRTARRTLQAYIARVRGALEQGGVGAGAIASEAGGYRLTTDPAGVDARQFADLVALGRRAASDGDHRAAVQSLESAMALWRGPAYAGFETTTFGQSEARRLGELRLAAQDDLFAAMIASGCGQRALPALEARVAEHPLRERSWALLVRARAAAGDQVAAIDALDRARRTLADELGVDPGEELQRLQQQVLSRDPALLAASPLPPQLLPPDTARIGGTEQLQALRQQWPPRDPRLGRRVLLLGDPGSSRWRLACELAVAVSSAGAPVVLGTQPAAPGAPFLRVIDARAGEPDGLADPAPGELQLVVGAPPLQTLAADTVVSTAPLTTQEVADVLAGYLLGATDAAELQRSAALIHARTGGNAAAVGERALAWAREAVAGRVATRSAASSASAQEQDAGRAALAEDVLAWSRLRTELTLDATTCPWPGLASYDEDQSQWFAGRERLTAELLARLAGETALLLVGGSGSGKSSLLRAGLLAGLAAGALPGSSTWVRVVMRPGQHPMRELTGALLAAAGGTGPDRVADLLARSLDGRGDAERVLLVIDQFEECWTVCTDPGEREAFLATVADLAADAARRTTVALAVRADHAGSIAGHPQLAQALAGRAVFVGPMVEGELRRAIEAPAARAGLALDIGLADALVADTLAEPGGLPLLSTAMADLWRAREGDRLTLAAYAASGGVGAAIARMAERVYAQFDEPHRRACRVLLLRLAGPGQGDGVVRRRVVMAELAALPDALIVDCVEPLQAARLLTVSEGHVEVAHEALFRSWPRLREWLAEDVSAREVQRRLTLAAAEWDAEGRDSGVLWGGARLAAAQDLLAGRPGEFTGVEAAFVTASTARLDAERAQAEQRARTAQRQNTRLRRLLAGLGITLALAVLAGSLALVSRNEAAAQEQTAVAQRLAATAMSEDYLSERMLSAVEAVRTQESPQTVGALLSVLAANPAITDRIDTPYRLLGADAGTGSTQGVTIANIEELRAFDMVTGESRVVWSEPGANLVELRVSPDGRYAAFLNGSWDGSRPPDLLVVDLQTGQPVWTRPVEDEPVVLLGGWDFTDVPGELAVATTTGIDVVAVDTSKSVRTITWDAIGPQWMRMARLSEGRVLLFAGEMQPALPARVVDLRTGRVVAVPGLGAEGSVSQDGRYAVSRPMAEAGPVSIVDLTSPGAESVEIDIDGEMRSAGFLPDGSGVVIGTDLGGVVLADAMTGRVRETFAEGHNGAVMGVVVTPDGSTVWSAGRDGDLIAWDASGERRLAQGRPVPLAVTSGQVSADGTRAAVWAVNPDGVPAQAAVLDLESGELLRGPYPQSTDEAQPPGAMAAGITPDSATLLLVVADGPDQPARLRAIDIASGDVRHETALPWWPTGVAATVDSAAAVVAGEGGVVRIDLADGRTTASTDLEPVPPFAEVQQTVAVSPDGRHVAVARRGEIVILDVGDLRAVRTWQAGQYEDVLALQWLDGGRALAFGGRLGRLEARSFPEGDTVIAPRQAFPGFVSDITANADGSLLALMGTDGESVLWDVAAGEPVGEPLVTPAGVTWGWVRFTADGRGLEVLYGSGTAYRFPIDTPTLIERACRIAAREPTAQEWAAMHGDQPQRPTCDRA